MNERQVAVLAEAESLSATAKNIGKLGDKYSPEYSRWAFGQWEMRKRAAEKFSRSAMMLFTRAGLEMATHERIAAYHASLFPRDVEVLDAGCGIGSDLVALGARGPVIGVDSDREHVDCARHNLSVYGFEGKVGRGDAVEVLAKGWDYVFADPGRRENGQRLVDPDVFSPNVDDLVDGMKRAKVGILKLTPMLRDDFLMRLGGDVRFISYGRECREALVVFPGEGGVSAVHIESGAVAPAQSLMESVREPGAYLYEADPALIRAHALGAMGMAGVGDSNGYLSSNERVESPWLRGYEVLWCGPWRIRMVKDALREGDWRVDAVKKRGVKVEPASVLRQVEVENGDPVQMVMYSVGEKIAVALVRALA